MDREQLQNFLKELLGPDGLNLKKNDGADRRELSIVKVDPFTEKKMKIPTNE